MNTMRKWRVRGESEEEVCCGNVCVSKSEEGKSVYIEGVSERKGVTCEKEKLKEERE